MMDDGLPGSPARLERERLDLALQASGLAEFEWDIARDIFIVSPRMAALTGLPPGPSAAEGGEYPYRSIHPDDRDRVRGEVREQVEARGAYQVEYRRLRPDDGREVWMRASGLVVRGRGGQAERLIGVLQDITEVKEEEARREALMGELDHRVKNVLAAVQSMANRTARGTTSLSAFVDAFSGRLKAMASANELLTAARWRGAAVADLAAAELGGLAQHQARWTGPELVLSPRAVNALSLALHELAANALKFGALSTPTGRVDLRWRTLPGGGVELIWTETGGPPVTAPGRDGFGLTMLGQVTGRQLNGEVTLDWRPEGLRARITAGAEALAPTPEAPAPAVERVTRGELGDAPAKGDSNLLGLRVLIVEDAALLAMELESALADAGAETVGPAYELAEALQLVEQPLDAAVLDANLNGHMVTPAAERLRARGVPFLFATGYGEAGGAPGGVGAPVIRKPYDVGAVVAAVAQLAGR
ncbi:MAG: PAS domain-containing protein [Caulobacteraceae bacterium]|nr:PAS domain-containing protein [Caulobacteraceae bacterium]